MFKVLYRKALQIRLVDYCKQREETADSSNGRVNQIAFKDLINGVQYFI